MKSQQSNPRLLAYTALLLTNYVIPGKATPVCKSCEICGSAACCVETTWGGYPECSAPNPENPYSCRVVSGECY